MDSQLKNYYFFLKGDVAQVGERSLRTAEVGGSNPLVSTFIDHTASHPQQEE